MAREKTFWIQNFKLQLFCFLNAYAWSKGERQKDTKEIFEIDKEKQELELVGEIQSSNSRNFQKLRCN